MPIRPKASVARLRYPNAPEDRRSFEHTGDEAANSAYFYPSLTTISQDPQLLGGRAVQSLVEMIEAQQLRIAPFKGIRKARGHQGALRSFWTMPDLFPEIRNAGLPSSRHPAAFPDAILVADRGFTILDHIAADLDGIVFECFSTLPAGRYSAWDPPFRIQRSPRGSA